MALFGKDRERSDRPRGFGPGAAPVPPRDPAPREGEMFERDKTTQVDETGGTSAVVNAQITGTSVVVHGKVTGDITARKRLEIRAPGKVFGNISTPSLVIHEGVVFEGQCTMSGTEPTRI